MNVPLANWAARASSPASRSSSVKLCPLACSSWLAWMAPLWLTRPSAGRAICFSSATMGRAPSFRARVKNWLKVG